MTASEFLAAKNIIAGILALLLILLLAPYLGIGFPRLNGPEATRPPSGHSEIRIPTGSREIQPATAEEAEPLRPVDERRATPAETRKGAGGNSLSEIEQLLK